MPTFNDLKGETEQIDNGVAFEYRTEAKRSNLLSKVFLILFVSLILTGAASYGIGYLVSGAVDMENETIFNVFIGAMYVSIFGLLIMSIAIPIALTRGKHSILPYYILYQVFISILLSTLFLCFGLEIMAISFGVTGVVFGIMALLGYLSKGSLHGLGLLSLAFFFGAIGLVLVNIFLQSETVAWIVSFVMFAYILFITMYDVRRIKDIINSGYENNNNNLVLYCAYILYVDYINILIRIVLYIAKAKSND